MSPLKKVEEDWDKLNKALRVLKGQILPTIPTLGISIKVIPGEYWFFHPGWFNLRWWWEETIEYAEHIHESIVASRAYGIHLRVLREELEDEEINLLSSYIKRTEFEHSHHLEDAIFRLFSFREKISWIVYELIAYHNTVPFTRISYHNVGRILANIKTSPRGLTSEAIDEIRSIFRGFDTDEVRKLFEFRHGFTHRLSPKPGQESFPLVVATGSSTWDTISMETLRIRHLDHLTSYVWRLFVTLTRRLANLNLPWSGFRLEVRKLQKIKENLEDRAHTGIGIHLPQGDLIVRCMKDCRGWFGTMVLNQPFREMDNEARRKLQDQVGEIFLKILPLSKEEREGVFKYIYLTYPDGVDHLNVFVTPRYYDRPLTAAEWARELAEKELSDASTEWKWANLEESKYAEPVINWSHKAKKAWIQFLKRETPPCVVEEKRKSDRAQCWVVLRTKPFDIKAKEENLKGRIVIFQYAESIEPHKKSKAKRSK